MHLTNQQSQLLQSLICVIRAQWGINIGYTCPAGSFLDEDNDFIIYAFVKEGIDPSNHISDQYWEYQLLHRLDLDTQYSGFMCRSTAKIPIHDDKVESFWKRLEDALASGELSFEAGITRVVGDTTYEITNKADGRFDIQIKTLNRVWGFRKSLEELRLERDSLLRTKTDLWEIKAKEFGFTPEMLKRIKADDARMLTAVELVEKEWGGSSG